MNAKPRLCRVCGFEFQPFNSLQKACGVQCAIVYGRKREATKAKRDYYSQDKGRAKELAQKAFNAFIRARDEDKPCISCGAVVASRWDAGHYISVGACESLRFSEDNCHKQCQKCNTHLSSNATQYRFGLIDRIGIEGVERLEGPQEMARFRLEDYKSIAAIYRKKLKDLKNPPEKL